MVNARNPKKKNYSIDRDGGGFIALPWSVVDCSAYISLSHPAKALLLELARQFVRNNNGRLLLSRNFLVKRGWKSSDTISRAKRELLNAGFIYETVMGHRPNKASWFAVTWMALDNLPGYDFGAREGFKRSAYRQNSSVKNDSLIPAHGTDKVAIAPRNGTELRLVTPQAGAIKSELLGSTVPPHGHHLDMPSVASNSLHVIQHEQKVC